MGGLSDKFPHGVSVLRDRLLELPWQPWGRGEGDGPGYPGHGSALFYCILVYYNAILLT